MPQAIAYLRTSSAANVGSDKDSEKRQRAAINSFAQAQGFTVAREFYDAAVSGADPLEARAGFSALLQFAAEHNVRTVIVENASRFARDAMVAELGYRMLVKAGFTLIAADDPDAFTNATPTGDLVRQIFRACRNSRKRILSPSYAAPVIASEPRPGVARACEAMT